MIVRIRKLLVILFFLSLLPALSYAEQVELSKKVQMETVTVGGGCFWCVEAVFQRVEGVISVLSGYGGGHVVNPTYEQVCDKKTGHAEIIRIAFDTAKVTYEELLEIFWKTHDPTTINQQGNDVGPQYRSVIYYHSEAQRQIAEQYKCELDNAEVFDNPIVTTIEPFLNFYPAESYHQDYYNNHQNQSYCYFVAKPKVEKLEKYFKDKMKKEYM